MIQVKYLENNFIEELLFTFDVSVSYNYACEKWLAELNQRRGEKKRCYSS